MGILPMNRRYDEIFGKHGGAEEAGKSGPFSA
jgi:hypothetical protein